MFSFLLYDKLNSTSLSRITESGISILKKESCSESEMIQEPLSEKSWTIIFLSAIASHLAEELYQNLKEEYFDIYTKKLINNQKSTDLWPENKKVVFMAAAAHVVHDTTGFSQFIRTASRIGKPIYEKNDLHYETSNLLGDTFMLFAKVCRFPELLQKTYPILDPDNEDSNED